MCWILDLGSWILDLGSWILDVLCWHMCIHTCMHTCNLDLESFVLDLICIIPLDLQIIRLSVAILVWIESLSPIRSIHCCFSVSVAVDRLAACRRCSLTGGTTKVAPSQRNVQWHRGNVPNAVANLKHRRGSH